jgi:hypothetical protein
MIKTKFLTVASLLLAISASAVEAGVPRAWVSGHGTDASGCGAPTNPCRSFQYVHDSIIEAGGEIDVLDGAGYGAITITKALSIVSDGAVAAVQQPTSGLNAITINAGVNDAVSLRGLTLDGIGAGNNGILFNSGANLSVINCVVRHFAVNGVLIQPASGTVNFLISNTIVSENGVNGFQYYAQGNPAVTGAIDHVSAINNAVGIEIDTVTHDNQGESISIAVLNSTGSNNSQTGLTAQKGFGELLIYNSSFNNNASYSMDIEAGLVVAIHSSVFDNSILNNSNIFSSGNNIISNVIGGGSLIENPTD